MPGKSWPSYGSRGYGSNNGSWQNGYRSYGYRGDKKYPSEESIKQMEKTIRDYQERYKIAEQKLLRTMPAQPGPVSLSPTASMSSVPFVDAEQEADKKKRLAYLLRCRKEATNKMDKEYFDARIGEIQQDVPDHVRLRKAQDILKRADIKLERNEKHMQKAILSLENAKRAKREAEEHLKDVQRDIGCRFLGMAFSREKIAFCRCFSLRSSLSSALFKAS